MDIKREELKLQNEVIENYTIDSSNLQTTPSSHSCGREPISILS